MKKLLVLGVNGFIGHHLSQRVLAQTDWEIHGMDMQDDRIGDLRPHPRFRFFEGDITINREWIGSTARSASPGGSTPAPSSSWIG